MKTTSFLILAALLVSSCSSSLSKDSSFAASFQSLTLKDTTVFAVEIGASASASLTATDTIALEVFNKYVPDSLHEPIAHILEGGDPVIRKLGRFPLDAQYDGLGVDIQAFWFRNQSVLIYDKQRQQVMQIFPVAEFYGGDGGQILRQSWLLSANNIMKELIVRESEHALRMGENEEEPTDVYEEWVAKYIWQGERFVEQPIPDSLDLIQRFPIKWE